MDASGVQYNAAVIVKLKKLYNNIRKHYELNLFRAFLMIDKYGRSNDRAAPSNSKPAKAVEAPKNYAPAPVQAPVVQPAQENNAKVELILNNTKKAALSIIDRVFRRNFTKQVKKWQFNAHPEKKLEFVHNEITKRSKD